MTRRQPGGQAIVEFALAAPLFLAFVFAIIQISLVFIAYYSEAEMALRGARWLAINPNTTDSGFATYMQGRILPGMVGGTPVVTAGTAGTPAVAVIGRLTVRFTPCVPSGPVCTYDGASDGRAAGDVLWVETQYDVSNWIIIPTTYRLGFSTFTLPTSLPPYRVYKMVE